MEAQAPQDYDVMAIDAFTGDSIPVHLITVEAVSQYLRHLKPKGVIAFHVSNRYLDLKPVLVEIARVHGLELAFMHESGEDGGTTSDWVLLTRDKEFLKKPEIAKIIEPVAPQPGLRPWTDDFSNLIEVFKF